jgi:hypothetical protein
MYEVCYQEPGSYSVRATLHAGFYEQRVDAVKKQRQILDDSAPYTLVWVQDTKTLESSLTFYNDDEVEVTEESK